MKITVDARYLIQIVCDDEIMPQARCTLCARMGYLDNTLGYSHNAEVLRNRLIHEKACLIGRRLKREK